MTKEPNMKTKDVHINSILAGDTIICRDGKTRTVTPEYMKTDSLLDQSLFGDTYNLGRIKVQKIIKF
jgi:hypothetical protein